MDIMNIQMSKVTLQGENISEYLKNKYPHSKANMTINAMNIFI